ncbi:MAG TPA: COX15/CtaA family protein [Oligoflexia bacterium]|nr:COX15/CtaA family protein [Oligoflexia bacterium]HMR25062.1 COX15/CtaA family protein [Oligoflexia bacterium]
MTVDQDISRRKCFALSLLTFLGYNFLVIAWGAWVRISFSGDGCGKSWPLCDDQFIPQAADMAQWIEWSHRLSTGIFGLVALTLFFWGRKLYPKKHPVRTSLIFMLLFTLSEALIGAALVKLELVGNNASIFRAWAIGFHQINSLALTLCIFLSFMQAQTLHELHPKFKFAFKLLLLFLSGVAFTGALAALAGTLYPSMNLITGFLADINSASPLLIRLRLSHPVLASLFCLLSFVWLLKQQEAFSSRKFSLLGSYLIVALSFGWATLLNLSPVWMKLLHLCLAHGTIIALSYAFLIAKKA